MSLRGPIPKRWICNACHKLARKLVHGTCASCTEKRAEQEMMDAIRWSVTCARPLVQLARAAAATALMLHDVATDPALKKAMMRVYPLGTPEVDQLLAELVQSPNPERHWQQTKRLLLAPPAPPPMPPLVPVPPPPAAIAPMESKDEGAEPDANDDTERPSTPVA